MDEIVRKLQAAEERAEPDVRPSRTQPIVVRVSADIIDKEMKRAVVAEDVPKGSVFSMISDEGPALGGEDSAPTPLSYFGAAVAF